MIGYYKTFRQHQAPIHTDRSHGNAVGLYFRVSRRESLRGVLNMNSSRQSSQMVTSRRADGYHAQIW